ncbi:Smr/MutS family protein [Primorskyibacter sp. S187A]|uniref:Smr/MutS family protein n=1 Tax=Primorskyibacter sp. S187A TaxID=3415130 RepID=UPI003C7BF747
MSRRKLRDEELELWKAVARSTQPMHPAKKDQAPRKPALAPKPIQAPREPMPSFRLGGRAASAPKAHDIAPSLVDQLRQADVAMDFKTYKRMVRGKLKPEGRIDLHGLTVQAAHPRLTRFILSAQADRKRLVLVITGKGRVRDDDDPIPTRVGVLRHEVPRWLSQAPLNTCVQQVTPASDRHGGYGAYYVYLRRV